MTIEQIVSEGLVVGGIVPRRRRRDLVVQTLERVGLTTEHLRRYPHEFSGGQRQRIGIARALVLKPRFIVCDEPVSALDVSVQSQILNLLADLQSEYGMSYLFIAHNLAVVEQLCDRVAVMYMGKIVETATVEDLYAHSRHPYTRSLLEAVPMPDPHGRARSMALPGEPPSPIDPPAGCAFRPRCPLATDDCRQESPILKSRLALPPGHQVACHQVK